MSTLPPELEREIFEIAALSDSVTIPSLLRLCGSRLRSLAVNGRSKLLPALSHLTQLCRWDGKLASQFGGHSAIDLSISAFRTLTHMDIWDGIEADNAVICPGLAALPCLTHLCLNHRQYNRLYGHVVVPRILAQCQHLQVLVSMPSPTGAKTLAKNLPTADIRFVVSFGRSYWKDWEVGARGGTNFWATADEFVARKRRDEIKVNR
ncbi:hypothetical protein K438DRAFT_1983499 [Mycena galopus ATCC 62051]|nr:hypothetical protein K438DRAFT_1983499 [Mycena galopus ATCC 62051]